MSLKFGLGNSKDDIEIQGEIDYDFFDNDSAGTNPTIAWTNVTASTESKLITSQIGLPIDNQTQYTYPCHSNSVNTSGTSHVQRTEQPYLGDSLLVTLNCKPVNNDDSLFFATASGPSPYLESCSKPLSVQTSSNLPDATEELNGSLTRPVVNIEKCQVSEGKNKYPKKVIETVIPNLEECPQYPLTVVTNCMGQDEEGNDKVEENSGSLSSSMTDSDDTSSLSEDSFDDLSESESITDVTPLHSPYYCDSPVPQIRPPEGSQPGCAGDGAKEMDCSEEEQCKKKDSVRFAEELGWYRETESEPVDLNALVAAIRRLEIQQGHRAVKQRNCITPPLVRPRKNMSFSNEEVRRIDQENQRLLKKILAQQTRSKPSTSQQRGSHVSSSQVNRYRQQRQAEIDNIALLKRIESAKPSRELSRVKLLRDYNRLSPSLSSRTQSRPSTASSSLHAPSNRTGRSHSLPSSNESSTSATPSTTQERPKTAQAISTLHAVSRLQKQRSLH